MTPRSVPGHHELDQLRAVVAALGALKSTYQTERHRLRRQRAAEVRRLRAAGWTPHALAVELGLTRSAVNQWLELPEPGDDPQAGVH